MEIVIFSGAGMSAESGISTFRDKDGLWEHYKIEDVATPEAWSRNSELVQNFYNQRRQQILQSEPNEAHKLIAQLESKHSVTVVTQNIDDLHERAGSTKVIHLHGNIRYSKSSGPNAEKAYYPIEGWELKMTDKCPDGYPLRPHVVWFGEAVPMYEECIKIMQSAEILIIIGTSLNVYPAAGLIHYAKQDIPKYIIDPNAKEFDVPKEYQLIVEGAENGMKQILQQL
jgi:NAD-dependent deacetylase